MARIRNVSDSALSVPLLGRVVEIDEAVEVPDAVYQAHSWPESLWAEVASPRKSTKGEE